MDKAFEDYLTGLVALRKRFVEHYDYRRLHESLQNVTPAEVYYGRRPAILTRREQIKRETLARRKRMNQRVA